jgi:hypothetical protein
VTEDAIAEGTSARGILTERGITMKYLGSLSILFGVSAAHAIVRKIIVDGNEYVLYRAFTVLIPLDIRDMTRAMTSIGSRSVLNGVTAN